MAPLCIGSRTVFEDATPEVVRDFFWDDEFRPKWDPMLAYFKILEEFPHTATMIVHWIKKFPFFCSDREYIIGRRIWEAGKTYYCVTKGVPYPGLPKRDKPRRVELYFSSWIIRAALYTMKTWDPQGCSKAGCPPWDVGNSQETAFSDSLEPASGEEEKGQVVDIQRKKDKGIDWKWIVIGGTVALVCGLHTGTIGKALLIGAGQRDVVAFLGLGFHSATRLICMVGGNTWTQFKISPPPQIHWVGPLDAHTLEAF
ncbi:hypothetical protein CK203_001023 [Vitis vinifera]|uniref:START domain-containing protein n=1 Tax=Vitis vinifera TaxID=29760 RepID=A0A438KKE1_VITVI|nr:hypothetical protein CK203_001023 [Vitis vinifera]